MFHLDPKQGFFCLNDFHPGREARVYDHCQYQDQRGPECFPVVGSLRLIPKVLLNGFTEFLSGCKVHCNGTICKGLKKKPHLRWRALVHFDLYSLLFYFTFFTVVDIAIYMYIHRKHAISICPQNHAIKCEEYQFNNIKLKLVFSLLVAAIRSNVTERRYKLI